MRRQVRVLGLGLALVATTGCVDYHVASGSRVEESDRVERQTGFQATANAAARDAPSVQVKFTRQIAGSVRKTTYHSREVVFTTDSLFDDLVVEGGVWPLFPVAIAWDLAAFSLSAPIIYPLGWLAREEPPAPEVRTEEYRRSDPLPAGARLVMSYEDGWVREEMVWESSDSVLVLDRLGAAREALASGLGRMEFTAWEAGRPQFKARFELCGDLAEQVSIVRASLASQSRLAQVNAWSELRDRCPPDARATRAALTAEIQRIGREFHASNPDFFNQGARSAAGTLESLRHQQVARSIEAVSRELASLQGRLDDPSNWPRWMALLVDLAGHLRDGRYPEGDPRRAADLRDAAKAFRTAAEFADALGDAEASRRYTQAALEVERGR